MKKMLQPWMLGLCSMALLVQSCKKDPAPIVPPAATTGNMTLQVQNYAGSTPLVLNTGNYTNAMGESFKVFVYKYYLTNFVFTKQDGSTYTQPNSYYLINAEEPSSLSWTLSDVPVADYTSVSFMIGVDEPRNTSGAQTGALDPANGMFWTWDTGYIMAKMEGESPASGSMDKRFSLHAGGFQGVYAPQKKVTLTLPKAAKVAAGVTPKITLRSDALQWFTAPTNLSFGTTYEIGSPGKAAFDLANNYADMMSVVSVE